MKKTRIKNVRVDFINSGNIGCCHIEADCKTEEDLKEVLDFAKKASELIPPDKNIK